MTDTRTPTEMKEVVREKYGQAALRVKSGGSSCCGATATTGCSDPITTKLGSEEDLLATVVGNRESFYREVLQPNEPTLAWAAAPTGRRSTP